MQSTGAEDTVEGETRAPVKIGLVSIIVPIFCGMPRSSCIFGVAKGTRCQELLQLLRANIHVAENQL